MSKKRQTNKTSAPQEGLLPCMDYLHGDVIDGEFEAACEYEYARESEILRQASEMLKRGTDFNEIPWTLENKFGCNSWFIQSPWGTIWLRRSFPARSWNQLNNWERKDILQMGGFSLPSHEVRPLRMSEVWDLNALGIFDEFKAMAEKQMEEKRAASFRSGVALWATRPTGEREPVLQPKIYPVIEGFPTHPREKSSRWVHALFTINFSKTKKRLTQEFEAWLDLPENKSRFKAHRQDPTGKTGLFRDRLKDLASWRLERNLGWKAAAEFVRTHRLKDAAGRPRPFLDARRGQGEKTPLNDALLYGHESGWSKAKSRAEKYRAKLIPWEYGVYAEKRAQQDAVRRQWIQSVSKRAGKILKKNS